MPHNIEHETRWGDVVDLKGNKQFSEKYRIGYGANNERYRIRRRGGMWEAQCDNPNVHISCFILTARTLNDMSKLLENLPKRDVLTGKPTTECPKLAGKIIKE